MKRVSFILLSTAALLCTSLVLGQSTAHALRIDDFSQDQAEITDSSTTAGGVNSTNDTVIQGTDLTAPERLIHAEVTGTNGTARRSLTAGISGGVYSHSQQTGAFGFSSLIYTGFGSVDLTGEGFGVELNILESDLGGKAHITLTDGANKEGKASIDIPEVAFGSPQILLFLFTNILPNIDLTDVTKIILEIDGRSVSSLDVAADFVSTATPEPASLLLIGSVLLSLAWLRRKQK